MIAQGSHDILTPQHMKDEFKKQLPHVEVVEINESGHWTILEQPEEMVRLTRSFFERAAVHT